MSRPSVAFASITALAIALAACSDSGRTPTEPGPAGATGAAIHGTVEGVGASGAAGTVSAAGVGGVTVRVQGTELQATTDSAGRFELQGVPRGDRVLVFQTPSESAPLGINDVADGERIDLAVEIAGSSVTVKDLRRSGPGFGGELRAQMQPSAWDLDWAQSAGTVSAMIRGERFDEVDLDSIRLIGTDPEADPLDPVRVQRQGNHVRAFFAKNLAILLLLEPAPGDVHELEIELTLDGEPSVLGVSIRVVGEGDDPDNENGENDNGDASAQGCGIGYWRNHPGSWGPTGLATADTVESVFAAAADYDEIAESTLAAALGFPGGPGVEGGARILVRQAVASALNAAHEDVSFPRALGDVVASVDAALDSGDRNAMTQLGGELDADNNLGCPL